MPKCRFFPYCSYIEDHGCTDDWCEHYQPMPDVDVLFKLADEIDILAIRLVPWGYGNSFKGYIQVRKNDKRCGVSGGRVIEILM